MAIYHLHAKVIQRSKGRSAIAAAAYRHATKSHDDALGLTYNYSKKQNVIHCEINVPIGAAPHLQLQSKWSLIEEIEGDCHASSERLWNLVEACEKRVDAQLARELEFSLPIELSQSENIQLARAFIHEQLVARGMMADWSVHWDLGNPHVHVMLSMRELTQDGFGKKCVEWNSKIFLNGLREQWANYANFHLQSLGYDARIDHRSYKDQGIDLIPSIHQGKAVSDMHRRGIATDVVQAANEIRCENLKRISSNPHILFNKLSAKSATFSEQQLVHELGQYINDQGKFSYQEKINLDFRQINSSQDLNGDDLDVADAAVLSPETILQVLKNIEHHESVFNEKTLAKAIEPFTGHAEQFAQALLQVKSSSELIHLGPGDDGRERFTTRAMFELENDIQSLADRLRETRHVKISSHMVSQALAHHQHALGKQLTEEQLNAVKHMLKPTAVSCVVGRAGTGKSFSLGAAKSVWEKQGLRVLGVALSGIAADGLKKDASIESRTIESFRYALKTKMLSLHHQDVIVMDEAGMTDSVSMLSILKAVQTAKAKLVLVGDHAQIQPVGPGASFRALLERLGFAEIQTVYRQKESWQRDATVHLSAGRVADALASYEAKGCIHFEKDETAAMSRLVQDWFSTRNSDSSHGKDLSQYLVITHKNQDVDLLNQHIRAERVKQHEIAEGYFVKNKLGNMQLSQHDRILFLKNDNRLGVSNGRFATVTSISFTESGKVNYFNVLLDGNDQEITINPNHYRDFTYGYAATVHKVQGMTVNHAFVYAGQSSWNRHLSYVALSRHRDSCHLYASQSVYQNQSQLQKRLGKYGIKDSLLDFPLAFAERRGIDTASLLKRLPQHLAERLKDFKDKIKQQAQIFIHPEQYAKQQQEQFAQKTKIENIQIQRIDARLVAAYVDANQNVGMTWQCVQTKLNALGFERISYQPKDFSLIKNTAEYQAFESAMQKRNQIAHQIMQAPERYEKAIEIYDLSHHQLQKQSHQYQCEKCITHYLEAKKTGKVVHQDKLAAEILNDIKAHYPILKNLDVDTKLLTQHATSHLRRQYFITLTQAEREAFKIVETYQAKTSAVGALYFENMKDAKAPIKHDLLKRLEQLTQIRNQLAYEILDNHADKKTHQNHSRFDKALDFYQIGKASIQFDKAPTEQQNQHAQTRWYKLQQSAAQHELNLSVTSYHRALFLGDIKQRMQLAANIMEDTSAHHGKIMALNANSKAIWQSIRQDAKRYEEHQCYLKLDLMQRHGFNAIKNYAATKREHAKAWRELFDSKKTANLDEKTFYQLTDKFVKRYTKQLNQQAASILENISHHLAGIDYFNLDIQSLEPKAYQHQCCLNIENYINEKNTLTRANVALTITKDPKHYHGLVIENKLNWQAIYKHARIAEKQQAFKSLTLDEKSLHRLTDKYKKANQAAGKSFAAFKNNSANQANNEKQKNKLQHLFAKQDYLAYRLAYQVSIISPGYLNEFAKQQRINANKLLKQAENYARQLNNIEHCQSAFKNVIHLAKQINQQANSNDIKPIIEKSLRAVEIATQLQNLCHYKQPESLKYAPNYLNGNNNELTKQTKVLSELKESLKELATLHQIDEKTIARNYQVTIKPILQAKQNHQHIDIPRLREDLNARAMEVAQHYLGEPKTKTPTTLRYGNNKGSLIITTQGQKRGLWRDFQTSVGGDMLSLIKHVTGNTNFKELLQEASRFLGGDSHYIKPIIKLSEKSANKTKTIDNDADTLAKIQKAQTIVNATQPIKNTLAERYLKEHRNINCTPNENTYRFHPKLKNWMTGSTHPALIIIARDKENNVCGIQAIFLDEKTARKANLGSHTKLSRGLIGEGALVQQGQQSQQHQKNAVTNIIAFAEGPETALSIAEAKPDWQVYCTFGVSNFDKVPLKIKSLPQNKNAKMIICQDNDGVDSGTAKSVARAAEKLAKQGIDVWLTEPTKPDNQKKWDFNDVLMHQNIEQIKQDLDNAKLYKTAITQEAIIKNIEASIKTIINPNEKFELTKNEITQPPQDNSFNLLLKQYVNLEIEQIRLVDDMHSAKVKDKIIAKEFTTKALAHNKQLIAFATQLNQHVDMKSEFENIKMIKAAKLSDRGGFAAIYARMQQDEFLQEDKQAVLMQLRTKVQRHVKLQMQDRSRKR